jgi:hypothetical protein
MRGGENFDDLKDIPIPLCLFEMTDNNAIVSITCPESLPKSKQKTIVRDLYFFKPPSIQRPNKEKGKIIINIEKNENNITIRDTDIGICSIDSPYLSNCTTDFNLTTDLEGNVLSYNEWCFSNITKSKKNYFIKNKYTKLSDETNNYNFTSEKYYETLNKFLPLLNPYMKYTQLFNFTQFKQLYNTCKNVTTTKKDERNLQQIEKVGIINNKANLFSYSHYTGTKYQINYIKNLGINSDYFEYLNNFKAGDKKYNLIHLKEYSNFDKILKKLSVLIKAGNKLALNLNENIQSDFYILTDIITKNITKLNDLIVYQDIINIFDSSFSLDNLTSLPLKTVEFSDDLKNELDNILNNIINDDLKRYIENFKEDITNYIGKSHELVYQLKESLKNLTNSLGSKKSGLTEIATYYLNYTSESYSDIIIKVKDILMNYYKNEYNSIIPKVEIILGNFENKVRNSIKSETEKLNNLLPKLENKNITIDNNNDEDSQKLISNIKNSNNYIYQIINQIMEKIKKSIGLKENNYFLSTSEIETNYEIFNSLIDNSLTVANKLDNDEYIDKIFDNIMIHFIENFTETIKFMDKIKELQFALSENL